VQEACLAALAEVLQPDQKQHQHLLEGLFSAKKTPFQHQQHMYTQDKALGADAAG
jgi:hypothetical protein